MYTIIDFCVVRFFEGKSRSRVVIQVDTEADIPTPDETWEPGSICVIANTHRYKRLNNEREWT